MDSIPAGAHRVKCENTHSHPYSLELSAQFTPGQRYTIPGVNHPNGRLKILLVEDLRTRIGRNVRTSDAVHYTAGTLNIRCDICDQWALPKYLWLCDGKPQPQPQPEADQPMLFDFAEPQRRNGGY